MKQIPTEARRMRILRMVDGDQNLFPIAHQWNSFRRCDEVFDWLIRHHITGITLSKWLREQFKNSTLEPVKYILKQIDKEKELKPIRVGRDFFLG